MEKASDRWLNRCMLVLISSFFFFFGDVGVRTGITSIFGVMDC